MECKGEAELRRWKMIAKSYVVLRVGWRESEWAKIEEEEMGGEDGGRMREPRWVALCDCRRWKGGWV